ncbi:hypothetical protein GCM10009075_31800 [Sphingomonas trueperi]
MVGKGGAAARQHDLYSLTKGKWHATRSRSGIGRLRKRAGGDMADDGARAPGTRSAIVDPPVHRRSVAFPPKGHAVSPARHHAPMIPSECSRGRPRRAQRVKIANGF